MNAPQTEVERALHLVASRHLAAASALQRWMGISFRRATELLDQLERQGHVGPADGSSAREIYVRHCEQCGRVGKRGFQTLTNDDHGIRITECSNRQACRKRWPKPVIEEAS